MFGHKLKLLPEVMYDLYEKPFSKWFSEFKQKLSRMSLLATETRTQGRMLC